MSESQSGRDASQASTDEREDGDVDVSDEDMEIEGEKDNRVSKNSRVLRIVPRAVRIGSYVAPIRGEVLLTSKCIILHTSTVERREPTKDVRLKLKTADMNGIWAELDGDDGSRVIILYMSLGGAREVRRTLNMRPADRIASATLPFFSPFSKVESQRRIIIFLDTLPCEDDEFAKLWKDIEGIRGDRFYRLISRERARLTLTQAMKSKSSVGNGAYSLHIHELGPDCTVRHIYDTRWFCLLCKGTPKKPVLCPCCSGYFCTSCYSETSNCPYCSEKVTDTGLLECRWVEDLGAHLKSLLAAEWGEFGGNIEVIETIITAYKKLQCIVCYRTVVDAVFMPDYLRMFCRRCVKASMFQYLPHTSFIDRKEKNVARLAWGENLCKLLDKLLAVTDAANFFDDYSDSNASCDESGVECEDASSSDADMEDVAAVHNEDQFEDEEGYDSVGMYGADVVFIEGDN